jgi:WD40 repeat protein
MDRRGVLWLVALAGAATGAAPPRPNVDALGDPLPPGVVARLGSVRICGGTGPLLFLPDGKTAACGLDLFEIGTGKRLRSFHLSDDRDDVVSLTACSADGRLLAGLSARGALRVWETATGRTVFKADLPAGRLPPGELGFSSDGKHLFCGGGGLGFRRWDVTTGKEVPLPKGVPTDPKALRVKPDGRRAALIDGGKLTVWNLKNGKRLHEMLGDWPDTTRLAWSPDGQLLAAVNPRTSPNVGFMVFDFISLTKRSLARDAGQIWNGNLVFSHDGKTLAAMARDSVTVWEVGGKRLARFYAKGRDDLLAVAFTRDNRPIVTTKQRGFVDAQTGKDFIEVPGHRSGVSALAVMPDGKTACTGGGDGTVRLWEVASGKQVAVLARDVGFARVVAVSPDAKFLAVGSNDALRVWRVRGRKAELIWSEKGTTIQAVFSPDSQRLTAWVGMIRTWDPATGRETSCIRHGHGSRDVCALAISADGRTLASGSLDGSVRLWNAADGKPIGLLSGHGERTSITGLAFLPDGRSLLSCGSDGTARLWEFATGEERKRFSQRTAVSGMRLSSDGSLAVFTAASPRGVSLWRPMTPDTDAAGCVEDVSIAFAFSPNGKWLLGSGDQGTVVVDVQRFVKPRPEAAGMADGELARRWTLLDGHAAKAYPALCDLAMAGDRAVELLGRHLRAVRQVKDEEAKPLLEQLDAEDFRQRNQAQARLAALGPGARSALQRALKTTQSAEVKHRVRQLLARLEGGPLTAEELRSVRGVEILERIGTKKAVAILEKLAAGEPTPPLTVHATDSLARLKQRKQ